MYTNGYQAAGAAQPNIGAYYAGAAPPARHERPHYQRNAAGGGNSEVANAGGAMHYGGGGGMYAGQNAGGYGGNSYRGNNASGAMGGGAGFYGGGGGGPGGYQPRGKNPNYVPRHQKPQGGGGGYQGNNYNNMQMSGGGGANLSKEERAELQREKAKNPGRNLSTPRWENLQPFQKNFYHAHPNTINMSEQDVAEIRKDLQITVSGNDIPYPLTTFEESTLPDYI